MKGPRKSQFEIDDAELGLKDEMDEFGLKAILKPDDQLQLTEQELKEEVTRVLTATNPHAPQNIVRFNFKECQYRPIPQVDQTSVHFWLEGHMLPKDSDEGRRQMAKDGTLPHEGLVEEDIDKDGIQDSSVLDTTDSTQKKLTNQFNFCERSTQTYNNPYRVRSQQKVIHNQKERGNMTEPPPRATYSANVTQWSIYDDYVADFEKQQEKSKEKKTGSSGTKSENKGKKKAIHGENPGPRKSQFEIDDAELGLKDEMDEFGLKAILKPDDQLQLTEQELKEEVTRVLTATNPHAPQNIVRFNFKECQYRPIPQVDQTSVHFWLEGHMLPKDSDEGRRQMAKDGTLPHEGLVEEDIDKDGIQDSSVLDTTDSTQKKLTNQFNFCERSTQTYNNPYRERGNMTEPPPRATYSANVTQWSIYDDYVADFEKQQEKSKEKKTGSSGTKSENKGKKKAIHGENPVDDLSRFAQPIKIVERMINQNTHDEIAQDFKYYEDPSDEFRDQAGTLLPMWMFTFERAKKLAVTALCWSPKYSDLFAVGHGSYDFLKQLNGLICFYTLKNPEYPEYIFETESGVLSLDLHPSLPHMLCVGFYDGAVGVYNINQRKTGPLYLSTAKTGKHTDPVWEVRWQPNDLDANLNFFSVSADGRVTSWTLVKVSLICHPFDLNDPVFIFDLGSPVGDVAWAPYSSTVFAAVTADGRVHVYDLSVNKYEPLCNQLVLAKKKTKLTHLAFNPKYSIIIVGDDRGQVTSLKLSPNLRKKPKVSGL
ncbi:hypothetical protein AHF37_04881 [Paragonimus kellicotti]|nr:hypothetical protein AHF37_04881 [Paragonimus kellicotti]